MRKGLINKKKQIDITDKQNPGIYSLIMAAVCLALLLTFTIMYFSSYTNPYMQKNMADISDGWRYGVGEEEPVHIMDVLSQTNVPVNETLHIYRILNESIPDAAIMLKSNHQWIRVLLDGETLYESPYDQKTKNPGMGLHFVLLPAHYVGKTLHIEISSPYASYSGAPGSVYIGDIPSLQTYTLFNRSIRHKILMSYCLAAGALIMGFAIMRRKRHHAWRGDFCFGVFSVLWGFYFPSGDYIAHQFLNPLQVSQLSIGLYFLYPLPLMLFFYYYFDKRKKAFLPAVALMGIFVVAAAALEISGTADFPDMLFIFNPLYILSTIYMIALGFTEIRKGSRFIRFAIICITIVFIISVQSMVSFYTTRIKQDETLYEMAIFSFIMAVWVYNAVKFLRERMEEQRDIMELSLKNAALDKFNREKTEFFQDMSHEMKAPLTVIATGIDFADQEIKAENGILSEAVDALDIIRAETQRLGRMVGSMAEIASINEANENRKKTNFAALLKEGADAFRYAMKQKNNTLTLKIDAGMPDVFIERDKVAQVIANLISNALCYTKDGNINISASFDDEYITTRISDTGIGIPHETLPMVFMRGVSGGSGTGYGLYICKTVVEAHGGGISIESEPGEGSSVIFTIPVYGGQEAGHG